jgi:hypothetical protein
MFTKKMILYEYVTFMNVKPDHLYLEIFRNWEAGNVEAFEKFVSFIRGIDLLKRE